MDVVGWLTKTETVEMTGCSGNGQTTANLLNCSSSAAAGNAMCNVQRCIPVSTDDASVERPRNLVFHDTVIMDRHKELILQRHHCHHGSSQRTDSTTSSLSSWIITKNWFYNVITVIMDHHKELILQRHHCHHGSSQRTDSTTSSLSSWIITKNWFYNVIIVIMDHHKELILQRHHCHHIHIYSCKLPHHCNLNTPNHSCLHSVSALAISVTALAISVEERHGVAILRA